LRAKWLGVINSDFMRDLRQNRGDVVDDLASERGRQRRPKIVSAHFTAQAARAAGRGVA
jgi:hypothetical protein